MRRVFEVDRGDARLRLDRLLVARLPDAAGWSRTRLAAWIREGRVAVDGVPATRAAQRLRPGQAVALDLPERPAAAHAAEDRPLTILYEDDALLAIDKPAGLVVHPTRRYPSGTLMNALLWHLGVQGVEARDGDGGRPRVHLVHRLDRETSGVLLVAKTPEVHRRIARAMARRAVRKEYLALVYGVPRAARDRIDLRIRRDPTTGRLVTSRHDGLSASTEVEVIATCSEQVAPSNGLRATCSEQVTLLRCTLITGRLHQIRVHLAGVGLPLVGDPVYGEPRWKGIADPAIRAACEGFPRQALHAWRVQLAHPETGAPLAIVAPPPPDLQALLDAAGLEPGTEPYGRAKAT